MTTSVEPILTTAIHWDYTMDLNIHAVWLWMLRIAIPVVIGVGVIVNGISVTVWSRHNCGVTKTARFYYLVLSILDFGPLLTYHLLYSFIGMTIAEEYGLNVMSNTYCSITNWLWYSSDMSANLIYVSFCIERVCMISSPLKAKGLFTLRRAMITTGMFLAYSYGINVICLLTYEVVDLPGGGLDCETNLAPLSLFIQYHYTIVEISLTSANALINTVLVIQILRSSRKRAKLTAVSDSAVSARELATTLTVTTIVSIHVILFVPDAICWTAFFGMKNSDVVTSNPPFAYSFLYVGLITTSATACAHVLNFFVYFTRIPAFRKAVLCRKP